MDKKSFTLIELLVVIAIIGLLSTVVLVSLQGLRSRARDTRRISDFNQIRTALESFYNDYGRYPVTEGGATWDHHWEVFSTCMETGAGCGPDATGTYSPPMKEIPQDPLDNPATLSDADPTYYFSWNGSSDQGFILRAALENLNNGALTSDSDGDWRASGDAACNDPYYCIKVNWRF